MVVAKRTPPTRRYPAPLALLATCGLAVLAVGCGGTSDRQDVREAVERFGSATADKDYQEICDELIAETLIESVEAVGLPCELAFRRGLENVEEPALAVGQVDVNKSKALVRVRSEAKGQPASEDLLELVLEGGEWKVSALAKPQPQRPQAPADR
jgi:hypothetical protein